MQIFCTFLRKYLHISKKCTIFAPAFQTTPHPGVLESNRKIGFGESEGNCALYCARRNSEAQFAERNGRLPEWLGIGLQNRGQQFESATDLTKMPPASGIFY